MELSQNAIPTHNCTSHHQPHYRPTSATPGGLSPPAHRICPKAEHLPLGVPIPKLVSSHNFAIDTYCIHSRCVFGDEMGKCSHARGISFFRGLSVQCRPTGRSIDRYLCPAATGGREWDVNRLLGIYMTWRSWNEWRFG
jgi:hypothetical protein